MYNTLHACRVSHNETTLNCGDTAATIKKGRNNADIEAVFTYILRKSIGTQRLILCDCVLFLCTSFFSELSKKVLDFPSGLW